MQRYVIRDARPDEAANLKEIGVRGWETTYADFVRTENRRTYLDGDFWSIERLTTVLATQDGINLVAEYEGRVTGFITCELIGNGRYEVTRLYVDPDARSGGIGSRLIETVLGQIRERGASEVLVNAFGDNHAARRFYERHGFKLIEDTYTCVGDQCLSDVWYALRL